MQQLKLGNNLIQIKKNYCNRTTITYDTRYDCCTIRPSYEYELLDKNFVVDVRVFWKLMDSIIQNKAWNTTKLLSRICAMRNILSVDDSKIYSLFINIFNKLKDDIRAKIEFVDDAKNERLLNYIIIQGKKFYELVINNPKTIDYIKDNENTTLVDLDHNIQTSINIISKFIQTPIIHAKTTYCEIRDNNEIESDDD